MGLRPDPGGLHYLGHAIGRNTLKQVLAANGIEPTLTRRKGMPWEAFLRLHWGAIAAADFLTVEVVAHDRDPLFTTEFRDVLSSSGVKAVKLPAQSPDLNAYAERFVRSIREECLSHVVPPGERHLRWIVSEDMKHYHLERNHQGLANERIEPREEPGRGRVTCRERLGGLLRCYHREAA